MKSKEQRGAAAAKARVSQRQRNASSGFAGVSMTDTN